MSGTLRSLAGDAFRSADVVSAALHPPLTPEQLVLDRYVFLPHARTGIAAALDTPFGWALPARATVVMRVPVADDSGRPDLAAEMTVHVHGPADVTGIDPRQVIRAYPKADAVDAEVDDLVHVEFDRPDLPWLFTPAGPDGQGRLVPWLTLVVAERRRIELGEQRGGTTRRARIRRDQLQPLHDAWAWAHAQVMGAKPETPAAAPTLEQRLGEGNAAHNLSRLVCPRRLDDHRAYVACVVPTFRAGVRSGLGLSPEETLAPAWGTAADFTAGDPMSMVDLPVYYSWSFGTGEDGNFESLARKVLPAVAPPGVGRRRVDATRPWVPVALAAGDPGAEIVVTGPVVSPQLPADSPEEAWPAEAAQHWAQPVTDELAAKLNRADVQAHAADPGPPLVGPPLYGSAHARRSRVETGPPDDAGQPEWFGRLNLDPRHRVVGGLGTRVVQAEQEDLMAAAWNQVLGIEAANRALRLAQLARHVSAALHRRHLARLTDAAVLSVTERVHGKVLDGPALSVLAAVRSSSLPPAVAGGGFRRLARVRGPVVRAALAAGPGPVRPEVAGPAVEALTVRDDLLTTDWVRPYRDPDGITGLGAAAAARLTEEVAAAIGSTVDRDALLARWRDDLARPAVPDHLSPAELDAAAIPDRLDMTGPLAVALLRRVLAVAPEPQAMADDAELAVTGAAHGLLLRALVEAAGPEHTREVGVARADAARLRLDGQPDPGDGSRVRVAGDVLLGFAAEAIRNARRFEVPLEELQQDAGRVGELVARARELDGGRVAEALRAIGERVVLSDGFAEPARSRISAPALALVAKLDPATTVPARVRGRLTAGSGRLPGWLRPDWFDDRRIEPVMAHPRFAHPMYEPLHRYDPEWMVPGLGLIPRPDMATLLETNNQFVEGYLVGLNHEFARELLWREFPTDQRGTYFSSFWTGTPELVADLHEAPWLDGPLGSHVDRSLDGRLVFLVRGDLVRRYPGVVAHAVREASAVNGIPVFEAEPPPVRTLFHVHLPPNVLLVGFAMDKARMAGPGERWWFTLSENPTEPRFGLDPSRDEPLSRDSLVWADFEVEPGRFLDATRHTALSFTGVPGPAAQRATWGTSSADVAFLLFQLPARAAFRGTTMVAGATR